MELVRSGRSLVIVQFRILCDEYSYREDLKRKGRTSFCLEVVAQYVVHWTPSPYAPSMTPDRSWFFLFPSNECRCYICTYSDKYTAIMRVDFAFLWHSFPW